MRKKTVLIFILIFITFYNSTINSVSDRTIINNKIIRISTTKKELVDTFAQISRNELDMPLIEEETLFSNLSLSVKLDEVLSVIEGSLTVDYYTNVYSTMSIPFHLYPSGMLYENRQGNIDILNVINTDSAANLSFIVLSDQQLMWVNLTSPLEPDQTVSLHITFKTTLPDGQDRANSFGLDSNQSRIYTCTAFYPVPCVYDEYDGWNTDPYIEIGDPFYFDMAYYDLVVEVPVGMSVAATGELLSSTIDGVTTVYHYKPNHPVREMVFSASRYFQMESKIVDGVNVTCFYLQVDDWLWNKNALDAGIQSFILFNDSFGSYPYSTYNIVEAYGFYGGMEYPCQVLISESLDRQHSDNPEFWFELIIVHETAHQWWCQLVGNDQIDYGHLDEGLVSWSTDYYFDYYNPNWSQFNPYWPLDIVRTYYKEYYQPSKVNQSAYNFIDTNMSYRFTAYQKAPLLLQKLRTIINHDNFIAGLRNFYEEYKFKIATFPDLQKGFEAVSDISLDWFFLPWFDNPYLPNYNFKDVDYDANQGEMNVTIEDLNEHKNEYPYAQQIYLQVTDIRQFGIFYFEQVWINGTTTLNFNLNIKGTPGAVQLVYGSDVLVQLSSAEESVLTYNNYSWYNVNPDFSWVPFKGGDWIEWNFKIHYSDSKNLINSLNNEGKLRCDLLSITKSTSTLNLETNLIFSPTIELLQQFDAEFVFKMDHEGHAFPYYILIFSPFVGYNFHFTEEWIDSMRYLDDFQVLQAEIKDEGKSITMQIVADSGNFTVEVNYNLEGILAQLDVQFDTFTPAGPEGPELNGQLTLDLYTSSFKSYKPEIVGLVELVLIPTTLSVIFAYVVWFIRKKHNQKKINLI
jgi:hypothetical protein